MTTVTNPSVGTLFLGSGTRSTILIGSEGLILVAQRIVGLTVAALSDSGYLVSQTSEALNFGGDSAFGGVIKDSQGAVFVGGYGQDYFLGPQDFFLSKFLPNGKLDLSFGIGGKVKTDFKADSYGYDLLIQEDQKIIQIGQVDNDFALARYNKDGSLDSTFGSNGKVVTNILLNDSAMSGVLQQDGKILVVGYALDRTVNNIILALVRYNANGTLDTTFNGTGKSTTYFGTQSVGVGVVIQSDGKIVCVAEGEGFMLARFNANGTLDTSYGVAGKVTTQFSNYANARDIAIQKDGKIIVCGSLYNRDGSDIVIARYNIDGSLDTSFDGDGLLITDLGGTDIPFALIVQADGKILVSGVGGIAPSSGRSIALTRYNTDGSLDKSFNGLKPLPVVKTEKHNLSVIVDKGVLGVDAVLLKGLTETSTLTDGVVTKHSVEYAGVTFDYAQIDSLITTVTRDGEFTSEFTKEINEYLNTNANISYSAAVGIVGVAKIDGTILIVAGADGNYVG